MPVYGRTEGWVASLMVIGLTSCSEGTTSPADMTPPAEISDLAIADSLGTSVTLIWTASGDDNRTGTGAEYDLRHAMWPITEANWDDADRVAGERGRSS
jgi:hypothetical protein